MMFPHELANCLPPGGPLTAEDDERIRKLMKDQFVLIYDFCDVRKCAAEKRDECDGNVLTLTYPPDAPCG